MTFYEVNLEVDAELADAFAGWLDGHVREMLALPGFLSAELFEVEDPPAGRRSFSVRYRLVDREALERYLGEHAPRMRGDGARRFGGRFTASRRILAARTVSATARAP